MINSSKRAAMPDQLSLEDWVRTHSHRDDPETSAEAARRAVFLAGQHHRLILQALTDHGPMTGDEVANVTPLDKFQVMRRMKELCEVGRVEDSGDRRPTPKGRPSVVWKIRVG